MRIAPEYKSDLMLMVVGQALLGIFAALNLDGGVLLKFWLCFTPLYWIGAIGLILRRPEDPSKADRQLIKYGFPIMFGSVIFLREAMNMVG